MNNLKKFRLNSGLTQNYVAFMVGLHIRNYQKIESGIHLPRVDRALAIASVLKTTVEDLFGSPSRQTENTNKS